MAIVGTVAACGATPAAQVTPTPSASPKALTLAAATPPDPGGEVGSASGEFESPAEMAVWNRLNLTEGHLNRLSTLEITGGQLKLVPKTSTWFDGFRGPLVYQELAGDIVLHTRVKAEGSKGGRPKQKFSLGGAMLRVPGSDAKPNWLSVTVGTGDTPGRVEVKETLNGSSKPQELPVKDGWVELVLARSGPVVVAFYKEEGGAWKVGRRWLRPDLAEVEVLQWGVTAYTDWDSLGTLKKDAAKANTTEIKGRPDLKLSVDFVRFLRPRLPEGVDAMNPAAVPDDVLIKALTPAGA
ncbi:hypothetical protein [Nonomuraea sp. NPDC050310]|uniref:hypothetical protein n=1 Tax=unclassified Nonomuraea TaxID=2593643 RepID=UPI003406526E